MPQSTKLQFSRMLGSDNNVSGVRRCFPTVDKRLWLSKAFYASFYVAIGALFPYLPVYFKQLKLSSHQNGILIGIRPLIQFCVTPLWGACADRFCKSKAIFLVSVLGWLVSNFSLYFVPVNNDPRLCDVYNYSNEDEISFQKSHISPVKPIGNTSNQNIITRQRTRKHVNDFYSRVSPYLDTTVPFIPFAFRDFRDVCSITSQGNKGLEDPDHWKEKPEVDIAKLLPSSQKQFQDSMSGVVRSGKHVSCNSKEFLFLLLVTIIGTIIAAPAQALADTVTLQSLGSETHKYGGVRLWGSLGWGIGGFSVGAAVSTNYRKDHCGEDVIDYGPCFYVYVAGMSAAFLFATQFQFDQTQSTKDSTTDNSKTENISEGLKVFRSPQFCFVIFIAFFCGSATGFIETFLFWYLHELGGGQLLFSVVNGLNCAAEVCVFFITDKLLCYLGHINVIYVTLFCYSVRFIYFYFVESPWVVLPAELLQGITTAAFWSSCVSYVGLHPGASNTVQGILNGVYMGLGFATGGFLGGSLVHVAGIKSSFLLYALVSFCLLLTFAVINNYIKK